MNRCRASLVAVVAVVAAAACVPTGSPAPTVARTPFATAVATPRVEPGTGDRITLADVLFVRSSLESDGTWVFQVTVSHEDAGWEHYANRWEVLTVEGNVLATRVLAHPHVDEQPFVRSLGGIVIPEETSEVRVRAHDGVHGYGGREVKVDLTIRAGQDYEVAR